MEAALLEPSWELAAGLPSACACALCSVGAWPRPRWLGFYGGGVVAACARETRLVFLLEADTEERAGGEREARRSKDSRGGRAGEDK
jgi:hypothetical protein